MVDTGGGEGAVGGGIGATQGADDPPGVTIYLRVDDLQRSLDQAEALGGATVLGPTELPGGYGSFALLTDPAGNTVGIWA
jgi:predicted enzyme related to lactoylglutathione lyase